MNVKIIQRGFLAAAVALSLLLPVAAHAGGNGHVVAKFETMSGDQMSQLKPGDTVVKVCRGCGAVQLIRVDKEGMGMDFTNKKCEYCGSEDTYFAVAKQPVPLKDQRKP